MSVIVIANVTGAQGQAIVERFQELIRRSQDGKSTIQVRGLTRNKGSTKAQNLLRGKEDFLELYSVDYNDASTLKEAFHNANALFLNVIMSKQESHQYKIMMEVALNSGTIRHVIYSSSSECQRNHGVPHWKTSWDTERKLQQMLRKQQQNHPITVHILRYAHCHENILTYYKPSKRGWMAFPWDPSVQVHTASVRDGARVACQLFLNPLRMPSGDIMDITTDVCSPHEMAAAVSRHKGQTVRAYKGPWMLLHMVRHLAYEPRSIAIMGKFIERNWSRDMVPAADKIRQFLKDEIDSGEPLDSMDRFCRRHFADDVGSTKSFDDDDDDDEEYECWECQG